MSPLVVGDWEGEEGSITALLCVLLSGGDLFVVLKTGWRKLLSISGIGISLISLSSLHPIVVWGLVVPDEADRLLVA